MEENKNKKEQQTVNANNANNGSVGNGGRKRRRRHRGGGNKSAAPQNVNGQTAQNTQNTQPAQNNANAHGAQGNRGGNNNGQNAQKPNNNASAHGGNRQDRQNQQNKKKQKGNNGNQGGGNKDDNRKDTYVYTLDGNLYINLTNKCSNGCDFCVRNERTSYYGNYLWLRQGDPTPEKVIAQANGFGDLSRFKEVVFCGFGEPTYRVAEMIALCDYFHEKGLKTRLNTNGQGNLINKRDIVPELKDKLDFVNVSLNASCAEKYQPICRSQFGESGFAALVEFAKLCTRNGVPCRFSIVDCIGEEEVEACKRLADSVKVPLYIRKYIADS